MSKRRSQESKRLQVAGYEIGAKVKEGSEVYVATKASTGRKVIVKLPSIGIDGQRELNYFYREVKVLAALDHPSIVSIIDAGETISGTPFFVRPFIPGQTFDEHIFPKSGKSRPDIRAQLQLFCKITAALHGVHERGIVHRNLKPENILVDDRGEPHILDFGIAFVPKEKQRERVREGVGSPVWMSPEQIRPGSLDTRSDIFTLGSILYYILSAGSVPFPPTNNCAPQKVLSQIIKADPVPLSQSNSRSLQIQLRDAGVDRPGATVEALQKITVKALAKSPAERYQTVLDMAFEIRRLIERDGSPNENQVTKFGPSSPAGNTNLAGRNKSSMQWPGLEAVKAVYNRLPERSANAAWELLPTERQFQIAKTMIEIALNAPKAADDITRSLVLHTKMVATIQRVPEILKDLAHQIGTSPWTALAPPNSSPNKADENDELKRIWHSLNPTQRAILRFMRNKADNVLNYDRIATNIVMPRLPGDGGSKADFSREISDKTVRNHCLPLFEAPLQLINRVGQRGGIHLTERGIRLIQLASRDFS